MNSWIKIVLFLTSQVFATIKIPPNTSFSAVSQSYAFLIANNCKYNVEQFDDLPYADEKNFTLPEDCIFFAVTSCEGGLGFRQACSVESTAKAHPHRQISVLFTVPVTRSRLKKRPFPALLDYPNIKLYRIRLHKYGKGTPLKNLMRYELILSTKFFTHANDVVRFVTLYKFGGIFMDMDAVVVKPFDTLPLSTTNFVGKEDEDTFSVGIVALSNDHMGRMLTYAAIRVLSQEFDPYGWISNGIEVFRKATVAVFNNYKLSVSSIEGDLFIQSGPNLNFTVYRSDYFFPLPFTQLSSYFKPGVLDVSTVYAAHVWNWMSQYMYVSEDSLYANLAKEFCPKTMRMFHFMHTRRSKAKKLFKSKSEGNEMNLRKLIKKRLTRFSGRLTECSDQMLNTSLSTV